MTAPSAYAVKIILNNATDVTQYAPYDKMLFEDNRATVSRFTLTLEKPSIEPTKGMDILVYAPATNTTVFVGYIVDVQARKRDNGIAPEYDLDCADRKIRLQKSVVPYGDYSGLDTDIISNLLGNATPDLGDIYDFTSGVNNLANNLDLAVNDDNILDKLKDLSDMAGADYRFEKGVASQLITFDSAVDSIPVLLTVPYTTPSLHFGGSLIGVGDTTLEISSTLGNGGGYCFRWYGADMTKAQILTLAINMVDSPDTRTITNIKFDYYISPASTVVFKAGTSFGVSMNATEDAAWHSVNWTSDVGATTWATSNGVNFLQIDPDQATNPATPFEIRIDNLEIVTSVPFAHYPVGPDSLQWDSSPDASNFDLDIGSGTDYGANFDLNLGGWDDYNSVIVTGGSENVAIDWTYAGNTYQNHYPLETFIKDIAVYKNTGSDATPTWTAQSLGKWGVDDRTVDGGSKDVLYDEANHWLYFNSAPATLNRTFRVTGSIKKPIRVLVETGETPVYTTTIYDENATTPEAAANIGFAALDKHAAIRRLDFETMNPGLKVGTSIHVTDTARGLDEQITIQRITVHWKGASGHAEFDVECGPDEESEADAGTLIAETDKRSRKKAAPASIGTTTASFLTDSAGNVLTDANDNPLFTVG